MRAVITVIACRAEHASNAVFAVSTIKAALIAAWSQQMFAEIAQRGVKLLKCHGAANIAGDASGSFSIVYWDAYVWADDFDKRRLGGSCERARGGRRAESDNGAKAIQRGSHATAPHRGAVHASSPHNRSGIVGISRESPRSTRDQCPIRDGPAKAIVPRCLHQSTVRCARRWLS